MNDTDSNTLDASARPGFPVPHGSAPWLSVEESPKVDGRRVIGWCREWSDCFIVKWSPNRPAPHWTTDDGAVTSYVPTHWQALPTPPNSKISNGGSAGQ